MYQPYRKELKNLSRELRKNMTDAELYLWSRIRRKQIINVQFYRQKPLLDYIVDFYCPKAKLIIELDGGQHYEPDHQLKDKEKDRVLKEKGFEVLRFDNLAVLKEIDSVVEVVRLKVVELLESPSIPLS